MSSQSNFGEQRRLADVCLDRVGRDAPEAFTYLLPDNLADRVQIGTQVAVPLRRTRAVGYVIGFPQRAEFKRLRSIQRVTSDLPAFDASLLSLARWMSAYYLCTLAEALRCMIPRGLQRTAETLFEVADSLVARHYAETLPADSKEAALLQVLLGTERALGRAELRQEIAGNFSAALQRLVEDGVVNEVGALSPAATRPRMVRVAEITEAGAQALAEGACGRAVRQAEVLAALEAGAPRPLAELPGARSSVSSLVARLVQRGWVLSYEVEDLRRPTEALDASGERVALEPQQEAALTQLRRALDQGKPQTFLLHGITASGKTEVYLGALEHVLATGKQGLILVPEISLTAQLMGLFRARLGDRVAILHSRLSAGERFDEWRRLKRGEAQVAVGARSAVFAPLANLGLLIVDEEHEPSYKQEITPRYHARTVAEQRAAMANACLLLGSATPSLESYHRAMTGGYRLLSLPRRVKDRPLPTVHVIDMRTAGTWHDGVAQTLSGPLLEKLETHVAAGGQAILYLNRRGFSTVLLCRTCGQAARCQHCDVSLTYHRADQSLRCHHCDHRQRAPEVCPKCGGPDIYLRGSGTQKVEEEVLSRLPDLRLLRLDRDTTTRKGSHVKLLREFGQGQADVLLGTQMVAKGLDFPRVTLVGIINADTALTIPDFRAAERAFQLLTQVAGRAGRGESVGEVVVQTYSPEHFSILSALRQNYPEFFSQEMAHRRELPYPPFVHLVNLVASAEDQQAAAAALAATETALHAAAQREQVNLGLVGPAECPLARLRGRWRHHLMIRHPSRATLNRLLREALRSLDKQARGLLTVDVDPVTLL